MPSDNICIKLKSRLECFVRFENMKYELRSLASVFCIAYLFFKYYFIYWYIAFTFNAIDVENISFFRDTWQ